MIDYNGIADSVTVRDYAESIGMKIGRNGMALCPFHGDRNPSMKVDGRYHCFACGADGNVINFVSELYGISLYEAALKISEEFGISTDSEFCNVKPAEKKINAREMKSRYMQYLISVEKELKKWLSDYKPEPGAEHLHPLFSAALHRIEYVGYLIDCLCECRTEDEIFQFVSQFDKEILI